MERYAVTEFRKRRRHLPHWEEPGGTYFVTFTLKRPGLCDLTRPDLAGVVIAALRHFHRIRLRLYDYTVMPDHAHAILQPIPRDEATEELHRLLGSIKGWSARTTNGILRRRGALWLHESYDHLIRDEADYVLRARYIWENPVCKGLVEQAEDWPWWGRGDLPWDPPNP